MLCISPLSRTKYSVADLEPGGLGCRGNRDNRTSKFGTANPGQRGLVLVFALDLEDIKEIGPGGVDFDQVFIRSWGRSRHSSDFEVQGPLLESV